METREQATGNREQELREKVIEQLSKFREELRTCNSTTYVSGARVVMRMDLIDKAIALLKEQAPREDKSVCKCVYGGSRFYVKIREIMRPILAPLTPEEELEQRLWDKTGWRYVQVDNDYCPICGGRVSHQTDNIRGRRGR